MAASDSNPHDQPDAQAPAAVLDVAALERRIAEEIKRCERHGTALSALVLIVDNLQELAHEHGAELRERTLAYIAGALQGELREFDRIGRPSDRELLLVLPGADTTRAEMVGRRVLDRVSTIKIEADGTRRALRFSLGLAVWTGEGDAGELLAQARAAARGGEDDPVTSSPPPLGQEPR